MKYLVISDIHGSALCLEKVLTAFRGDFDNIIICGDYLNHGPRNPLPEGWDTKKTAELLNSYKDRIICVRGNCDSEVDEMVLEFPCLSSYTNVFDSGRRFFIHHGHLYSKEELASRLPEKTVVISGHTHIYELEQTENAVFFNPGSVSLPKNGNQKTCGLIEVNADGSTKVSLYTIEKELLKEAEV